MVSERRICVKTKLCGEVRGDVFKARVHAGIEARERGAGKLPDEDLINVEPGNRVISRK